MSLPTSVTSQGLKRALRKEIRTALSKIPRDLIQNESTKVTQHLLALPQYKQCQRLSVYLSMDKEVDTTAILQHAFDSGKACYIPRWTATDMSMVRLSSFADYQQLPVNRWGIPEPQMDEPREDVMQVGGPDLILMPCLAFDESRNRLGHGKGYYDRFLQICRDVSQENGQSPPITIGLALTAQLLQSRTIPSEPFDIIPDFVITPTKVYGPSA